MEITKEEEAQIHALSDSELAAVFAIVEAVECAPHEYGAALKEVQLEYAEMFGPYTVVQKLRTRLRKLHPIQNPSSSK